MRIKELEKERTKKLKNWQALIALNRTSQGRKL